MWRKIWVGATILTALILAEVYATYLIPEWRKFFYNVLSTKDQSKIHMVLTYFCTVFGGLLITQSLKKYVGRVTALHIRTYLTNLLYNKWVTSEKHSVADNPSQRINEDCKIATDRAITVITEVLISAILVIMLIWQSRHDTAIVTSAIIYTLVISIVAALFKRPLINNEIAVQRAEADHRHTLSSIALGNSDENGQANTLYQIIVDKYKMYLKVLLGYTVFSSTQSQVSVLIPWAILAPAYFSGHMTLGEFMGSTSIFELIVANSTILVSIYPELTQAQASWIRIKEFYKSL